MLCVLCLIVMAHPWAFAQKLELVVQTGHPYAVESMAFHPNGTLLASSSNGSSIIKLWDTSTGKEVRALRGHADDIVSLCFSPDGRLLASGSRDGTIKLWDMHTGAEQRTLPGHHGRDLSALAFSPNSSL